jgi:hypothetical protein
MFDGTLKGKNEETKCKCLMIWLIWHHALYVIYDRRP